MLLVNARAGVSKIHGIGLIAQEFIPKGTRIWRFQSGFDLMLSEEQLQPLSAPAQQHVRYYAFYDPEKRAYVLSGDDDRFTNHSDEPNTENVYTGAGDFETSASRDIQAGEEITWNYRGWISHDFLNAPER